MKRQETIVAAVALGVAVFTLWLYRPSTENGFLHWDDEPYIENAAKHSTLSFETIKWAFISTRIFYYHPLTLLSHALDCRLWGLNPAGHHATNVVLHGANTALVVVFTWLLLETVGLSFGERLAVAAGVGLVFGIHPLQVESVAWIAERKNVLCGFFFLASLCAYVAARREARPPKWSWLVVALGLAAMLSKPMAVSLPVVMLVMDFYPLVRQKTLGWPRLLKEKTMLLALAALFCGITLVTQSQIGAMATVGGRGFGDRMLVATRGIVFYLWKLIWPAWLSPYYPLAGAVSLSNNEYVLGVACLFAVTGLCVWRWRREPARLAAWISFLALIIPVSGLFQSGAQAAADRFMYLAMLPPVLLIAAGCVWAWRRLSLLGRAALAALLACQLAFFAFRARGQIFAWRNDETLWRTVLARFPDSGFANAALAQVLLSNGQPDEGTARALRAVEVAPWVAHAHTTLAFAYLVTHRYAEAEREAQQSLGQEPGHAQTLFILACSQGRLGEFDAAYDTLSKLLALHPNYASYVAQSEDLATLREAPDYGPKLQALLEVTK